MDQKAGLSNWQHGELYVTPSERTAVNYAEGYAEYGGEVMTQCREGLDLLSQLDQSSAQEVLEHAAPGIRRLIAGGGKPILVELINVCVWGLEAETQRDRDQEIEALLQMSERDREIRGQQTNFRLTPGSGVVGQVFFLSVDDPAYPLSDYSKERAFRQ